MIHYLKDKKLFSITTRNTSYLFGLNGNYLQHLYWGESVNPEDCGFLLS